MVQYDKVSICSLNRVVDFDGWINSVNNAKVESFVWIVRKEGFH